MDKTKIGAILALVALGGFLALTKMQDAPAPPGDPDDHEAGLDATPAPSVNPTDAAKNAAKVSGGVTALKIEDERPGKGPSAEDGDLLLMDYKGMLLDGSVFDQSYGREPFNFTLGGGQVIKGWDQGIKGMKAGGKRKLTIPAALGYGAAGSPPKIPGGATLVFEVEMINIKKKAK